MEPETALAITVLFALPDEARAFQANALSKEVRVGVSGMGAEKAKRAVESLFSNPTGQELLLVCGFAGGLKDGLAVGSIILVESVLSSEAPYAALNIDDPILKIREGWGVKSVTGSLVSVPSVLTSSEEKRACAERTGAIAVDMETFSAVKTAQALGVRCLAIRVITDGVNDALPLDFNAFSNAQGEPDRGKIIAHVLLHPRKVPALIRLGGRSSKAAKNLSSFLCALIVADALMESHAEKHF